MRSKSHLDIWNSCLLNTKSQEVEKVKKKNQKNNASEIVRSLNTDMNYGFHLRLFTVCFNLSLADSLSNTSERESKFLAVYFWIGDGRFEIRICIQFTNDALYLSWNSKLSPPYRAFDLLFALILLHHLKLTPHPPQGQLKWQSASWKTEKNQSSFFIFFVRFLKQ